MVLFILAAVVAAAFVAAYSDVSPNERLQARANPDTWGDSQHCH